jgi:hypothetical protein
MTPERWQQIKGVFDQAIACEPDQRVTFVRQVCATDEDLYREVVSLLGSYATTNSFFEKPIVAQRPAGDRSYFRCLEASQVRRSVAQLIAEKSSRKEKTK